MIIYVTAPLTDRVSQLIVFAKTFVIVSPQPKIEKIEETYKEAYRGNEVNRTMTTEQSTHLGN